MRPQEPHSGQGFNKKTNREGRGDGARSTDGIRLTTTESNSRSTTDNKPVCFKQTQQNTAKKPFTSNGAASGCACPTEVKPSPPCALSSLTPPVLCLHFLCALEVAQILWDIRITKPEKTHLQTQNLNKQTKQEKIDWKFTNFPLHCDQHGIWFLWNFKFWSVRRSG